MPKPINTSTVVGASRKELGMSMQVFSKAMGYSAGYLKRVEAGMQRETKPVVSKAAGLVSGSSHPIAALMQISMEVRRHMNSYTPEQRARLDREARKIILEANAIYRAGP